MAGKKEIAAAVFSFVYDNYLMNTPTPVIKEALRKVNQLIITLDDEKEEKPLATPPLPKSILLEAIPENICLPEKKVDNNDSPLAAPAIEKKQRAPRKDKGVKRKCSTLPL